MKRFFVLVALAVASFSVYFLYGDVVESTEGIPASVQDAGLAWFEGNASKAFFFVDGSGRARVRVALFRDAVPSRVYVLSESDQQFFPEFLERLEKRLDSWDVSVSRVPLRGLTLLTPGILVVASSAFPREFISSGGLVQWIRGGGVVVHVGLPFSYVWDSKGLAANPDWEIQKEGLGVDFVSDDALSGYRLEAKNGSAYRRGSWQVFKNGGYLAAYPRPLDRGFSSGFSAGDAVADFVLNASWQDPLTEFEGNFFLPQTIFSQPFSTSATHALVWLDGGNASRRLHFSLNRSDLRVLNPAVAWINESLSVSLFSNRSRGSRFTYSLVQDGRVLESREFGQVSSGLFLLSKSIGFNKSGDFLISFSDGGASSYSAVHVQAPEVRIAKADPGTKRISAMVLVDGVAYARQPVYWNGSVFYTDAGGAIRFEDLSFHGDGKTYVVEVGPVAVNARVQSTAGFLSSWPDRLMGVGALAFFAVAFGLSSRMGQFVRVDPPEKLHALRQTVDAGFLVDAVLHVNRVFGWTRMPVRLAELKTHLERGLGDPHAVVLPESLSRAVAGASAQLAMDGGGLVACRSWYPDESGLRAAFFRRRLLDVFVTSGWLISWVNEGIRARKGKKVLVFRLDAARERVKAGCGNWLSLLDLERLLRA
ncbi:hypothetical protein HY572_05700 [Candidatus Micrarchaeota archaeon]|nr:hypothetical protein [Candidatus Micrarchaeota archaeon]